MYECLDCGCRFDTVFTDFEKHGLQRPPYEQYSCCPACYSRRIRKVKNLHCRCCGAKLPKERTEYCSDACCKNWYALQNRERKRRKMRFCDQLHTVVRQAEEYNKEHGTRYSYGQFIALIMPRLNKGGAV